MVVLIYKYCDYSTKIPLQIITTGISIVPFIMHGQLTYKKQSTNFYWSLTFCPYLYILLFFRESRNQMWFHINSIPIKKQIGGHGGRVVTLSPPTSGIGVLFLAWPQVGKLVVACCWSAVYNIEP